MIEFTPPEPPAFDASCALEPAYRLLDHYTSYRTDVTVDGMKHENVVLFDFLKTLRDHPDYEAAKSRFLKNIEGVLEREGGKLEWLERDL
ncbi:hypothetical protein [Deinococcus cellulosilyticus]|uniref:Uncharacterized protein n=1 Tax=Deinococcus cellulosilyticus (strain DSM 18568 / NBRC 106333 / KACC 11606 / 5516J-15) TaxID=1223518 RepID=A0A511MXR3_DEIC1|nr:hypothetical protein [Deinococcus cellulosilyticus]GEM45141.1 hypothetical protein DC3_07760 [Deinococcus cellulosilyticus NBRC 106333 = KACC 11606]